MASTATGSAFEFEVQLGPHGPDELSVRWAVANHAIDGGLALIESLEPGDGRGA